MIRPLTVATFLLACGSGLYLYQSKHEVQLLDRTIERTVHETGALREQSRLLAAEWTMLNDPERLRQFSDTYLKLKTIAPSQFTSLADLNSRLPAPLPEAPAHSDEQDQVPVALEDVPPAVIDSAPGAVADEDLPVPPIPAIPPAPIVASVARPSEPRAAEIRVPDHAAPARPAVADSQVRPPTANEARQPDQRPSSDQHVTRMADARADVRVPPTQQQRPAAYVAPRPVQVNAPPAPAPTPVYAAAASRPAVAPAPAPYSGSLLGMARGSMPPAPRPTPVNATYNAN
jgi:hypothetical protein